MCLHTRTVITQEDESVCIECGVVTEKMYEYSNYIPVSIDECENDIMKDFLLDICHNHHIPPSLAPNILQQYKEQLTDERLKQYSRNELLAYATFTQLIDNGISRTPIEVAYYYQINHLRLWRIGLSQSRVDRVNSRDLLSRYGDELRLPYNLNPDILAVIHQMESFTCAKPETVVASAIHVVIEKGEVTSLTHSPTLREIANVCNVSTTSVRSLANRYYRQSK